jgi:parallel beta-helix repeat protein
MSGWSLTVQTDRPCYDVGNIVCISGRLTYNDGPKQSVEVGISVTASVSGNPYYYGSPTTDTDGKYSVNFRLRSDAELGTYVVHANAEGVQNQTTFQVAEPICIEENGDVEPVEAPISRNGNAYTLTDNIATNSTNGIIIEKSDIILDGAGFMLDGRGLPNSNGINLTSVNNVTIENILIESFQDGVYQYLCSQCCIIDSNLFHNGNGIYFRQASSDTIEGNSITRNSHAGILLDGSYDNSICGNSLANTISSKFGTVSLRGSSYSNSLVDNIFANNTMYGVYIEASYTNSIFHNNFFNNTYQGFVTPDSSGNVWDNGYPSGGNYWSDYNWTDLLCGPHQNVTGSDAIGDTSYAIYGNDVDHYPLMQPWTGLLSRSSISITFSVNLAAVNLPVTCTAAVFGSNPTGTVIWSTNSSTGNFSQSVSTMFSGNCSTTYIDTSPGTTTITASYSGDSNNAQSNASNTLTVCPITKFDQTGVGSGFTGTIITIDGINYTTSDLPVSFLWVEGSSHDFSYPSPLSAGTDEQYVWKSTAGLSNVQNEALIVTASGIVIGNYSAQYYLTLATSPSDANTPFGQGWYDACSYASISTAQFVDIVSGSSRYNFTGWTTGDMIEITSSTSPSTTILMDKASARALTLVRVWYAKAVAVR